MRILYALNSYRPYIDGVGVSIERQALGLVARGHEAAIVAPALTFSDVEEERKGIRVNRLRALKLFADQWRIPVFPDRGLARVLETFDPDVVVVSVPFLLSRAAWQIARDAGIPVVGITGVMPEWFSYNFGLPKSLTSVVGNQLWKLITDYYNQCDQVVGVTETALDFLRQCGLGRPSQVISNGVQLDRFRPRPRDTALARKLGVPDKPTVVYAGRLDAEKRMETWIRAIPHVLRQLDAHFVIGGDGTERPALEDLARRLGVAGHVTFPGFLDADEYERLYSLGTVFAIASPAELQSIVTLEAAASGLPIVAVNAGALPELCRPGANGSLFELGDSSGMAAALVEILSNPALARQMGAASRRIAEAHDIEESYRHYEELYAVVVASKAAEVPAA